MAGLFFQTVDVIKQRPAPGARGGIAPPQTHAVRISQRAPVALVGSSAAGRVNQELAVCAQRIRAAMPVVGGVLIRVALHEAKDVNDDGVRAQNFISLELLGTGRVPTLVVGLHLNTPRRTPRAPRGWVSRSIYLWATS